MVNMLLIVSKWTRIESPTLFFAKIAVARKLNIVDFQSPVVGKTTQLQFSVIGEGFAIELVRTECEQFCECSISK